MILPKQLEKEHLEAEVMSALEKDSIELYIGSQTRIPLLTFNPELRTNIFYAKSLNELVIGYESIEKALANELHGLQKVGGESDRISRLLIVTNEGSPRFYRNLEPLQKKHGPRLLICRLDIASMMMGSILGLKDRAVKAVLLNKKKSVVKVLKSLLPQP